MSIGGIGIGFRFRAATMGFFDKPKVMRHIDKRIARTLTRFGAYTRRRARASIKERKRPSKPGMPPSSHLGLLRKLILFSYVRHSRSVVIGPARISAGSALAVPGALEYGGPSIVMSGSRWRNGVSTRRKQRVNIKARPFMRPAFAIEVALLPATWRRANVA